MLLKQSLVDDVNALFAASSAFDQDVPLSVNSGNYSQIEGVNTDTFQQDDMLFA